MRSRLNWDLKVLFFKERGKPEYPDKNLSEQGREPTTNLTHIRRRRQDSNPGHIDGRRVRITVSSFVFRLYLGSAVVRAVALHHYGLVCRKPEVTSWRIEFGFQKTIQSELCEDLQIYLFIYLFI